MPETMSAAPSRRLIVGELPRFTAFRAALRNELGYRAERLASGAVIVSDGSRIVDRFCSVQAAIDGYARHMPASLAT
jgi:hypothetical protein